MLSTTRTITHAGGLLTMVALGLSLGSPALACNAPRMAAMGLQPSAKVSSLRNLGIFAPPRLMGRPQAREASGQVIADPLNPSIVGLWQVMNLENGKPIDLSFEAYHADGTEILIDQTPPAEGNVCIGTWLQTGSLTFKLTHPALSFDMEGNFVGTVMIREVVTLDRSGNRFTGTYTVDVFDVQGEPQGHFEGEFIGHRINPV